MLASIGAHSYTDAVALGGEGRVVYGHDFLHVFAGAERVLAEMVAAVGDGDLWTIHHRREAAERVGARAVHSLLPESEILASRFRLLTPVLPALVRARPLPDADVLITSSYAFAHAMRTRNAAPHVCLCHSPLRFAWSATDDYARRWAPDPVRRIAFEAVAAAARRQDRRSTRGVDRYVTISSFVSKILEERLGVESVRLKAPVDLSRFTPCPDGGHDGYFLFCGRLSEPYKRPTAVVEAFADLPRERLVVVGDGPEAARLRRIATPNVEFRGYLDDERLAPLMRRCAALVFPSRDDLGLVPLEVMASGRPVIALREGGALESVVDGLTGIFLDEVTPSAIRDAVRRFDPDDWVGAEIARYAAQWDRERFREEFARITRETVAARR